MESVSPLAVAHGTVLQVVLPARTAVLQALTPVDGLRVAQLVPGWTALAVSVADLAESNQEPHWQLLVTWPVRYQPAWGVPALPFLLGGRLKDFGWWVHDAPVSSEAVADLGRAGWGLPHRLARFRLKRDDQEWRAEVRNDHALLMILRAPAGKAQRRLAHTIPLVSRQGDELLRTPLRLEGVGLQHPIGTSAELGLGDDARLAELQPALPRRPRALAVRYYHDFHTVLWPARQRFRFGPDGPDPLAALAPDWGGTDNLAGGLPH